MCSILISQTQGEKVCYLPWGLFTSEEWEGPPRGAETGPSCLHSTPHGARAICLCGFQGGFILLSSSLMSQPQGCLLSVPWGQSFL